MCLESSREVGRLEKIAKAPSLESHVPMQALVCTSTSSMSSFPSSSARLKQRLLVAALAKKGTVGGSLITRNRAMLIHCKKYSLSRLDSTTIA